MSDILTIQFSGRSVSKRMYDDNSLNIKESKDDFHQREEIVPWLDSRSDIISRDIEREIKRALPPGVQVNVNIEFNYGSIEWAGVVIVLDWMARLGSSAGLIEYIGKGVKIAIDKVVRRNIRNQTKYCEAVNTEVVVNQSSDKVLAQQQQTVVVKPLNWQLILSGLNTIISLLILVLLLWNFHQIA